MPDSDLRDWTIEYSELRLRLLFAAETRPRRMGDHPFLFGTIRATLSLYVLILFVDLWAHWDQYGWDGMPWKIALVLTVVIGGGIAYQLAVRNWLEIFPRTGLPKTDRGSYHQELELLRSRLVDVRYPSSDEPVNGQSTDQVEDQDIGFKPGRPTPSTGKE